MTSHKIPLCIPLAILVLLGIGGFLFLYSRQPKAVVAEPDVREEWQLLDVHSFTLSAPQGWEFKPRQGIDSYVGQVSGEGVTLEFDYGPYSWPLPEETDPDHVITYEMIGGHKAKMAIPKITGKGTVGVYFEDIKAGSSMRLQISGKYLTAEQQETVLDIFRTIRFPETDATWADLNKPLLE